MIKRPNKPQESCFDTIYRFQGVLFIISVPLLLICLVLFVMPRTPSNTLEEYPFKNRKASPNYRNGNPSISLPAALSSMTYAVIFDAGSSGSRVHVFCFDQHLDLVPIGKNLELFLQTKPGLSAYSDNPPKAAESLLPLLSSAENSVPLELRSITSVRVGATAGLRALEGDASDRILQEVRDLLKYKSALRSKSESVIVLDGTQEGSFQWVTINYLLGNLGKKYSDTVGVVDLGGGSVQMAYAISEADAAISPKQLDGEDSYVKEMYLNQSKYYLYVHSYLHYGLLAARAEVLKVSQEAGNPCIMGGYHGTYSYGGVSHDASASPSGASLNKCKAIVLRVINGNTSACVHMKCTFGGVWNGGGGDGQKNLFVASFFFDKAVEANFVDSNLSTAKVHPLDFEDAAKRACETKMEDAKSAYPKTDEDNLPYLCMDLTYQLILLIDGFGLDLWQEITLVKKVKYHDSEIEAAWPLGSAIDLVSETKLP